MNELFSYKNQKVVKKIQKEEAKLKAAKENNPKKQYDLAMKKKELVQEALADIDVDEMYDIFEKLENCVHTGEKLEIKNLRSKYDSNTFEYDDLLELRLKFNLYYERINKNLKKYNNLKKLEKIY